MLSSDLSLQVFLSVKSNVIQLVKFTYMNSHYSSSSATYIKDCPGTCINGYEVDEAWLLVELEAFLWEQCKAALKQEMHVVTASNYMYIS